MHKFLNTVILFVCLASLAFGAPLVVTDLQSPTVIRRVDFLANLQALSGTSTIKAVYVEGRTSKGDGYEGFFRWDSSNLSARITTDAQKGIYVAPNSAPTGASGAWVRQDAWPVKLSWFNPDPTGTTDSYPAFRDAVKAVELKGSGEVLVAHGIYKIMTGIVANTGVVLKAQTRTDVTTNTNGSGNVAARPTIIWGGGVEGYMYKVKPAVVGEVVWGGGSVDIEWNGNDVAAVAVHLDNTKFAVFDGKVRQVVFAGVLVDSASGAPGNFSMKNHIRSLEFVWGASPASQNAHGLMLSGNGSNVPSTQQIVGDVSGLVYNGSLVKINETDNAQFLSVHGVVQDGGTGYAIDIRNVGAQASNHNVFFYAVGKVFLDDGIKGTLFMNYNSEGGGFYSIGTSKWDGELVDYVTAERFKSHVFKMRKWITLPSGNFVGDAATSTADSAFQWRALSFPNVGSPRASVLWPSDQDLADGQIEGIDLFYTTNGSGGNLRVKFTLSTQAVGGATALATPEHEYTVTIPQAGQYTLAKYSYTVAPVVAYTKHDLIAFAVQRLAADGADTATDEMILIGARINYKSTGPDSPGGGLYFAPAWD